MSEQPRETSGPMPSPPGKPNPNRSRRALTLVLVVIALSLLAWRSIYVLDDTQLGWLSGGTCGTGTAVANPGVHLKCPWQSVCRFSRQLRWREIGPAERATASGGSVILTATACWRLTPEGLARRVQLSLDDDALGAQIATVLSEGLDREVSQHPLAQFLTGDTAAGPTDDLCLGESVRAGRAPWILERFGLELMDVSVIRVALSNAQRQAEADRIALAAASQGAEIRSKAEKDAEQIKTKAQADAAAIRVDGRTRAAKLIANARRPELESLLKAIEGYRASMDKDTTLVLEGGREFFRLIESTSAAEPGPSTPSRPAPSATR